MNNKIDSAIYSINHMNNLASRDQWVNKLSPLVKLVITVLYIVLVVSFDRYDIAGLVGMIVYPVAGMILAELSWRDTIKRMRIVLPFVCLIGLFNPIFDREIVMGIPVSFGGTVQVIAVSGGFLSMCTLIIKGVFTVFATYMLIATTSIDRICYGLQQLHLPGIIITQVMLTYRYISLLLGEVNNITTSYALRAPGQKGIHHKVWGSLTGQLLLRSIDRSEMVYESMTLRGYTGNYSYIGAGEHIGAGDILYMLFWCGLFVIIRYIPVITIVGSITGGIIS